MSRSESVAMGIPPSRWPRARLRNLHRSARRAGPYCPADGPIRWPTPCRAGDKAGVRRPAGGLAPRELFLASAPRGTDAARAMRRYPRFVGSFDRLSFLTHYGLDDGFVAACHGVAALIAPGIRIIDITHLVPPGDVRRGAAVFAQTLPYLPRGVHVAVVDPGVGTTRRGIAVQAGDGILVGPDNGVLSWAIDRVGGATSAYHLTNGDLWLHPLSQTFHGRDIFIPVAAHLAAGTDTQQARNALIDSYPDFAQAGVGPRRFAAQQPLRHLRRLDAGVAEIGIDSSRGSGADEGHRKTYQRQTMFQGGQHQRFDGHRVIQVRIRKAQHEVRLPLQAGNGFQQASRPVAFDDHGKETLLAHTRIQRFGGVS